LLQALLHACRRNISSRLHSSMLSGHKGITLVLSARIRLYCSSTSTFGGNY
jgi:hypothetical protein